MTNEFTSATGAKCPVCGAFAGPLRLCPSCGARISQRMSLRIFRWLSVLLATAGLALLWMAARRQEIPVIHVGEIQSTMNFAYIRVAGTVASDARVFRDGDRVSGLRFTVEDGTGTIDVRAARERARQLVESNRIPRAGDRVNVAGSLNVSADSVSLWLQVPDHLVLDRGSPAERTVFPLADVRLPHSGKSVFIEGRIVTAVAPREGTRAPWRIRLRDASGEADAVCFSDVIQSLPDAAALRSGAWLRGPAKIHEYRGAAQLSLGLGIEVTLPDRPVEIAAPRKPVIEQPPAAQPEEQKINGPTPFENAAVTDQPVVTLGLADLNVTMTGRVVRVQGRLGEPRRLRVGVAFPITQGETAAQVVFWNRFIPAEMRTQLAEGVRVEVEGRVNAHQERLEIVPQRPENVRILPEAAP